MVVVYLYNGSVSVYPAAWLYSSRHALRREREVPHRHGGGRIRGLEDGMMWRNLGPLNVLVLLLCSFLCIVCVCASLCTCLVHCCWVNGSMLCGFVAWFGLACRVLFALCFPPMCAFLPVCAPFVCCLRCV